MKYKCYAQLFQNSARKGKKEIWNWGDKIKTNKIMVGLNITLSIITLNIKDSDYYVRRKN